MPKTMAGSSDRAAIVERWRGGLKLVPEDWPREGAEE